MSQTLSIEVSSSPRKTLLFVSVFFLLCIWGISTHEMWRDEAQAWMIALASKTPLDVWKNTAQEGHPPTWHFLLWLLKSIGAPIESMQVLHALLGTSAVYVFCRHSRFHWLEKIAFCLGYFILYEWTIVSRNYTGGVLFLFLALANFRHRNSETAISSMKFFLPLAISGLFNVFSLAIVFALSCYLFLQYLSEKRLPNLYCVAGFICTCLFSAWSVARANLGTTPVSQFSDGFFSLNSINTAQGIYTQVHALASAGWWGNHTFSPDIELVARFISLSFLALLSLALFERPALLLFYYLSLLALFIILIGIGRTGFRHSGFLFLASISTIWLVLDNSESSRAPFRYLLKAARSCLWVLLAFHLLAGLIALWRDTNSPFSAAKSVAIAIKKHSSMQKKDRPFRLAGFVDWASTPVAGYLGMQIFNPLSNREEYFVSWLERPTQPEATVVNRIEAFSKSHTEAIYVILTAPILSSTSYLLLGKFENSGAVDAEKYYLYYHMR
jgi:hypothetical protein